MAQVCFSEGFRISKIILKSLYLQDTSSLRGINITINCTLFESENGLVVSTFVCHTGDPDSNPYPGDIVPSSIILFMFVKW